MAHLVVPTALLLALAASDQRTPAQEKRKCLHCIRYYEFNNNNDSVPRLIALLDQFRPRLWVEVGLSADWGAEFVSLIRLLEPDDYDPALLQQHVTAWFSRQRLLFQDLHILDEVVGPEAVSEHQSCTYHAIKNAMECPPICVDGRTFHLWSPAQGDKKTFMDAAERVSNLVEASVDRLQSELLDSVQADFQVFNMAAWHRSQTSMTLDDQDLFRKLTRARLRRLFRLSHSDIDKGIRQFYQVAPIVYARYTDGADNRDLWSVVFDSQEMAWANEGGHVEELRFSDLTSIIIK